jgi:aldose 1-epimerase
MAIKKLSNMKLAKIFFRVCMIVMICSFQNSPATKPATMQKGITKVDWGKLGGNKIYLFTLTNSNGTQVKITNYGAIITSFAARDKAGNRSSVVVGFDSLETYLQKPPYFGALIGRYANRIANANFTVDGKKYTLAANNGKNTLHGGLKGFDKVVWNASVENNSLPSLSLSYLSKDGEEGFPGNLKVNVQYSLTDDDELRIEYNAETDKATPVNLTNHSYFNLTGDVNNTILNHTLMIAANDYTPVDSTLIPTGEIKPVQATPFDFTTPKTVGKDMDLVKGGYDHNWVLNRKGGSLQKVAVLTDSVSGRSLEVYTTEPGLQFYTGNFLNGKFINHDGKPVKLHTALCLETQHFPDSPNQPGFPSTILRPGEKYHSVTVYKILLNTKMDFVH